jgi:hypothetical protein
MDTLHDLGHAWQAVPVPGGVATDWDCPHCLTRSLVPFDSICPDLVANALRKVEAERDEARRTLARIVEKIGPDYVSMEGGPPMAVDLDPLEAVSGLIEQATAHADEASRARGEAARLREEVARLRAVVRS